MCINRVLGLPKGSSIGLVDTSLVSNLHAENIYFKFKGYPHDKLAKMPSGINNIGLHDKAKPRLQPRNYNQTELNENYGMNKYKL